MTPELTTEQKQRRARKSTPKPTQLVLFEPPRAHPLPVTQSPRAAEIAAETEMRATALRVMSKKAAGKAKALAAKPRVQRCKS